LLLVARLGVDDEPAARSEPGVVDLRLLLDELLVGDDLGLADRLASLLGRRVGPLGGRALGGLAPGTHGAVADRGGGLVPGRDGVGALDRRVGGGGALEGVVGVDLAHRSNNLKTASPKAKSRVAM